MTLKDAIIAGKLAGGGGYPEPTGTKQISITTNGTTTEDVKAYADAEITVNVSSGGGGVPENDVMFYDYDGTVVASYSAADFAALDAMPDNPTHEGLTAQGWNWTLSDAKSYVASYGMLNIGQMYITTSGATEIDVVVEDLAKKPTMMFGINGAAVIDWGDGNTTDVSGSSLTSRYARNHEYASGGAYTIKITVSSGSIRLLGTSSYYSALFCGGSSATPLDACYRSMVRAIRLGSSIDRMDQYCLGQMGCLEYVTIPDNITYFGKSLFSNDYLLKHITIPKGAQYVLDNAFDSTYGMTSCCLPNTIASYGSTVFVGANKLKRITIAGGSSLNGSAFTSCLDLRSVIIPDNITSMGNQGFSSCLQLRKVHISTAMTAIPNSFFNGAYNLMTVTIPASVTSIGSSAFNSCSGLKELHMKPTTPPTASSGFLDSSYNSLKIYVPQGTLATYQSASDWSSYSSQMIEES